MDHANNQRPDPTRTESEEVMDLAGGRALMLGFAAGTTTEDVPRLFLDQFPNEKALENLREDGRIWFYPEDLPQLVDTLSRWLGAYREWDRDNASGPLPHLNLGGLNPPGQP